MIGVTSVSDNPGGEELLARLDEACMDLIGLLPSFPEWAEARERVIQYLQQCFQAGREVEVAADMIMQANGIEKLLDA